MDARVPPRYDGAELVGVWPRAFAEVAVTFVITQPCIDTLDQSCVDVCPVDCIHDARTEGIVEGSGGYTKIKELQSWAKARRSPDDGA